jgi:hypothetical protein
MNQPNVPVPGAPPAPTAPAAPKDHELRDPPDESVAGEEDPGSGLEQFVDALHQPPPPEGVKGSRDPYGPGGTPPSGADSGQRSAPEGNTSAPSTSSK